MPNDLIELVKQQARDKNIPKPIKESTGFKPVSSDIENIGIGIDYEKYRDYIEPTEFDMSNMLEMDKLRAERQSIWEQARIKAANFVPNVLVGMARDVGDLGVIATEWGKDRDYTNWLTEWADNNKDVFSKSGFLNDIYSTHDGEGIDLTGTGLLNIGVGLVESITQFGLEAVVTAGILNPAFGVVAKGMSRMATASRAANLVAKGSKAANLATKTNRYADILEGSAKWLSKTGSQTANSALLGHFESSMSAKDTYERTYNSIVGDLKAKFGEQKGEEQAKELSRQAMIDMVQLNTLALTALNYKAIESLYAPIESLRSLQKTGLLNRGSSDKIPFKESLLAAKTSELGQKYIKGQVGKQFLIEQSKESLEEVIGGVTPKMAERYAKRRAEGEEQSLVGIITELDFLDDAWDAEGALNAISGFIGGAGTKIVMDFNPLSKHVAYDKEGKPIMLTDQDGKEIGTKEVRMTANKYQRQQREATFDRYANTALKDIDTLMSLNKEIADMSVDGKSSESDIEAKRRQLFDLKQYHGVVGGTTEHLIQDFKDIANIDNTADLGIAAGQAAEKAKENLENAKKVVEGKEVTPEDKETITKLETEYNALKEESIKLLGHTEASAKGFVAKNKNGLNTNSGNIDNSYKDRANKSIESLQESAKKYDEFKTRYGFGDYEQYQVSEALYRSWLDAKRTEDNYKASKKWRDTESAPIEKELEDSGVEAEVIKFAKLKSEVEALHDTEEIKRLHPDQFSKEEVNNINQLISQKERELKEASIRIENRFKPLEAAESKTLKEEELFDNAVSRASQLFQKIKDIQQGTGDTKTKLEDIQKERDNTLKEIADLEGNIEGYVAPKSKVGRPSNKIRQYLLSKERLDKANKKIQEIENREREANTEIDRNTEEYKKAQKELEQAEEEQANAANSYQNFLKEWETEANTIEALNSDINRIKDIIKKSQGYKQANFQSQIDEVSYKAMKAEFNKMQTNEGIDNYIKEYKKTLDKIEIKKKEKAKKVEDKKKENEKEDDIKKVNEIKEKLGKQAKINTPVPPKVTPTQQATPTTTPTSTSKEEQLEETEIEKLDKKMQKEYDKIKSYKGEHNRIYYIHPTTGKKGLTFKEASKEITEKYDKLRSKIRENKPKDKDTTLRDKLVTIVTIGLAEKTLEVNKEDTSTYINPDTGETFNRVSSIKFEVKYRSMEKEMRDKGKTDVEIAEKLKEVKLKDKKGNEDMQKDKAIQQRSTRGNIMDVTLRDTLPNIDNITLDQFRIIFLNNAEEENKLARDKGKAEALPFSFDSIEQYYNVLKEFQRINPSLDFITDTKSLWGIVLGSQYAGTVDIIAIDRDTGLVHIIDLKTSENDRNNPETYSYEDYKKSDSAQQSSYASLFEQRTGIKVASISLFPIRVQDSNGHYNQITMSVTEETPGEINGTFKAEVNKEIYPFTDATKIVEDTKVSKPQENEVFNSVIINNLISKIDDEDIYENKDNEDKFKEALGENSKWIFDALELETISNDLIETISKFKRIVDIYKERFKGNQTLIYKLNKLKGGAPGAFAGAVENLIKTNVDKKEIHPDEISNLFMLSVYSGMVAPTLTSIEKETDISGLFNGNGIASSMVRDELSKLIQDGDEIDASVKESIIDDELGNLVENPTKLSEQAQNEISDSDRFNIAVKHIQEVMDKHKKLGSNDVNQDLINTFERITKILNRKSTQSRLLEFTGMQVDNNEVMNRFAPYLIGYFIGRATTEVETAKTETDKKKKVKTLGIVKEYYYDKGLKNHKAAANTEFGNKGRLEPEQVIEQLNERKDNEGYLVTTSLGASGGSGTATTQHGIGPNFGLEVTAVEEYDFDHNSEVTYEVIGLDDDKGNEIEIASYDSKGHINITTWGAFKKIHEGNLEILHNNVPIRVRIKGKPDGKPIYVHDLMWIDKRNVADGKEGGNVEAQRIILRNFRTSIIEGNTEGKLGVHSIGWLNKDGAIDTLRNKMRNDISNRGITKILGVMGKQGQAVNMLNNLVALSDNNSYTGNSEIFTKMVGMPIVMLPSISGELIPYPVRTNTLNEAGIVPTVKQLILDIVSGDKGINENIEYLKNFVYVDSYKNVKDSRELSNTTGGDNANYAKIGMSQNGKEVVISWGGVYTFSNEKDFEVKAEEMLKNVRINVNPEAMTGEVKVKKVEEGVLVDTDVLIEDFYIDNLKTELLEKVWTDKEDKNRSAFFNNPVRNMTIVPTNSMRSKNFNSDEQVNYEQGTGATDANTKTVTDSNITPDNLVKKGEIIDFSQNESYSDPFAFRCKN